MPTHSSSDAIAQAPRLRSQGCSGWTCGALTALLGIAAPASHAALAEPADPYSPRIEVESLPHAMRARSVVSSTRVLFDTPADGLRTRMWWGKGALEVGAGANVSPSNKAPGLATAPTIGTAVVGLRAQLSRGTHLAIERDTLATSVNSGAAAPLEVSRVALEFKAVGNSKSVQPLSSGLLRLQMSGTSSLQFKPRSGGMAVTYRAKF